MKFIQTLILLCVILCFGCTEKEAPAPAPKPPEAPSEAAPAGPVELQANWVPGKRYLQSLTMYQRNLTYARSLVAPLEQQISTRQEYSIDVITNDPVAELALQFRSFGLRIVQGGKVVLDFDSDAPASTKTNEVQKSLQRLVGQKLTYFNSTSNTVDRVEGIENVRNEVLRETPPQAQVLLAGMLAQDALENLVELHQGLPPGPVAIGDKWPLQLRFSLGPAGAAILSATNTFTGWAERQDKRCALIKFSGTFVLDVSTNSPSPQAATPIIEDGIVNGQSWFDPKQGIMLESVTEQSMILAVIFPKASPTASDRNVTNRVNTTLTLKLLDIQNAP